MQAIATIGLDIAKQSFFVHAEDAKGKAVVKKALKREEVLAFFAKLPLGCLVGLEACAAAHYWAREIIKLGHDVRLIPPARVKAFVPRQKNDAADAQGICTAVKQPGMRFVPVKSLEQQSLLMARTRCATCWWASGCRRSTPCAAISARSALWSRPGPPMRASSSSG